MEFCDSYSAHFIKPGMNSVQHCVHYISGLLGTQRRKNIETIENDVSESDYQGMEQFMSSSPWSHQDVMDHVARDASEWIGDPDNAGFMVDEVSFLKKGKCSAGVSRQWAGRIGKVDNCQVAVFGCLANEKRYTAIDFDLYLPKDWVDDEQRCEKAKIPKEKRVYKAKWELGLSMVRHARANGVKFGYVGCDSLYGHNAKFVNSLEDDGENFMGDVKKDKKVFLLKPLIEVPPSESETNKAGRPRTRSRLHEDNKAVETSVEDLVKELDDDEFEVIAFRKGDKGQVCGRFWMTEIWHWDKDEAHARKRILVVRKDSDGSVKYSLTNLPEGLPLEYYAKIQGQRFWIEHAFHEAKSQLGMAQYQVRLWAGWHHHMALVCMALLFAGKYKTELAEEVPLLSARDITELLAFYLPRRNHTEHEVHEQIRKRHENRQRDIDRRAFHQTGIPDI